MYTIYMVHGPWIIQELSPSLSNIKVYPGRIWEWTDESQNYRVDETEKFI